MAEPPVDHADAERRQLHLAEVALRAFARHATGPGDRPHLMAVLLAEYDRRGAELVRVPSDMAVLRGERDRHGAALDAARAEVERLRAARERAFVVCDDLDRMAAEDESRPGVTDPKARAYYAGLAAAEQEAARRLRLALAITDG